ncbi:hypothetical protein H0H93_001983, partial [Arthromyces matolae]
MHFPGIASCILSTVSVALAVLHDGLETLSTSHYDFIVVGGLCLPLLNNLPLQLIDAFHRWDSRERHRKSSQRKHGMESARHRKWSVKSEDGMYYTRGPSSAFDKYARLTSDPGWSWKDLQPYIRKNERWADPIDHHDTSGQFDPAVHGYHGTNAVSLHGYPQNIDSRVIQITRDLPDEFPFNLDMNSGDPLGLGYLQLTIDKGKRSSSATSYLAPHILKRRNLHVLVNTQVTRIIKTGTSRGRPAFGALEACCGKTGHCRRFRASKEIILSAGVIGTPHLLLLSGIGEPSQLRSVGIRPVLNLHDVGRNFSDHPALTLRWRVNSSETVNDIMTNSALRAKYLRQWEINQTGP